MFSASSFAWSAPSSASLDALLLLAFRFAKALRFALAFGFVEPRAPPHQTMKGINANYIHGADAADVLRQVRNRRIRLTTKLGSPLQYYN